MCLSTLLRQCCGLQGIPRMFDLFYRLLIDYTEDKNNPDGIWQGYIFSVSMFAVGLIQSITLQQYFHVAYCLGLKVRTAVVGMVYSKVM